MICSERYKVKLATRIVKFYLCNTEESIFGHDDDVSIRLNWHEVSTC